MEEAAGQEVSERKEDEMVVDERESHGLEGEAEHSGAEEVPGKKRHHRRKAKYCSICEKMVMNVGRHCRDIHKISYNVLSGEGKKKCPLCDKYVKHLVKHRKGAKHDKDDTQVKELVMSLDKRRRDNTAKSPEPNSPFFLDCLLQKFLALFAIRLRRGKTLGLCGKAEIYSAKNSFYLQF
ncbi:unnamed protein product [Clavelina lepadiformis]|uniref:C2H2-type domain-containing protein n=1 Tax=Clavelina lepadiformis TaxID=159417 RepID=A0ABP0F3D2_CLALP